MSNEDVGGIVVQQTLRLIRGIGSPVARVEADPMSVDELEAVYDSAFANRVALLLLTVHERSDWPDSFRERLTALRHRESMTRSVIAELARTLNRICPDQYVVFKSLKPFPATPNDTDVLYLGGVKDYQVAYEALLNEGYLFHEWAPMQQTIIDPRGVGHIGAGKKGGTYYIDFYQEVATDYFAYMNKHRLRSFLVDGVVEGVPVRLLRAEPELAIILFHSVFPERTYQLEHFFLALHYMAQDGFDTELFVRFAQANGMTRALRESLSITHELHVGAFGVKAPALSECRSLLGGRTREGSRFVSGGFVTPHMFSVGTFFGSFGEKLKDPHSLRSLAVQAVRMLDPRFFVDVMGSLRARLSEKGVYHQE